VNLEGVRLAKLLATGKDTARIFGVFTRQLFLGVPHQRSWSKSDGKIVLLTHIYDNLGEDEA
jgi:hypothetical protein